MSTPLCYNVILLGKTGAGKSASGNSIVGQNSFDSRESFKTVTKEVQKESMTSDGVRLDVFDTPGLFGPGTNNDDVMRKWQHLLDLCPSVPTVFLLVMKTTRLTPEEKNTVELIQNFIPSHLLQNTWILFTRGDELEREGLSIEMFIEETEELKRVVQRFNNRYHVFNNIKHNPDQIRRLIKKIRRNQKPFSGTEDVRVVLVGKTGVGKSATGNTILRKKIFKELISSKSVTSVCQKGSVKVRQRRVTVIDTPGLFDTNITNEEIIKEVAKCITMAAPGPHVFLLVLTVGQRFTQEEQEAVKMIQDRFGEESRRYTMVLFTRGDDLRKMSIEDFIKNSNHSLQNIIKQCGNRYHVFNNTNTEDQTQVTALLEKINSMVAVNGGSCYTNEMFQKVEKALQEEQERILRKKKEEIEREKEKLRAKHEAEQEKLKMMLTEEQQNLLKERKEKEEEFQKKEAQKKEETNEERKKELDEKLKEEREAFNKVMEVKDQACKKKIKEDQQYEKEKYEREKEEMRKRREEEAREEAEKKLCDEMEKGIKVGGSVGGTVGGTVGGVIGCVGGPFGAAVGAAVGTAVGTAVGGFIGWFCKR